jgi:alkylated DNA repair dioxygenase AlkB
LVERTDIGEGAWVDVAYGWLGEADDIFDVLVSRVPWTAERRPMYGAMVEVPRLLAFYDVASTLPDDRLDAARRALDEHYASAFAGDSGDAPRIPSQGADSRTVASSDGFVTAGLCLYRDGKDSVAWHGDTIGRGGRSDTVVAIVSFGAPRKLLLRSRAGGPTRSFRLASGDLIVMGGSCQRRFEHCVPKTARAVGPRVSVQFRQRGVR